MTTEETATPECIRRAMETYDEGGELAMLSYLAGETQCDSQGVSMSDVWNMPDGGVVVASHEAYMFIKTGKKVGERTMFIGSRPKYPFPQPEGPGLFRGWPRYDFMWTLAMRQVGTGGKRPVSGDDPAIGYHESFLLSPALAETMRKAMDEYDMPDFLLQMIEEEAMQVAEEIVDRLPEKEVEALRDRMLI